MLAAGAPSLPWLYRYARSLFFSGSGQEAWPGAFTTPLVMLIILADLVRKHGAGVKYAQTPMDSHMSSDLLMLSV